MSAYSPEVVEAVKELLDIGVALSAEKNYPKLLESILSEARRITRCDAGTLYLVDDNHLSFQIIQNDQLGLCQGGSGKPIDLPPIKITQATVAGYCALSKKVINIGDVYGTVSSELDFSGPRRYDAITGYHTKSMLVVPLEDSDDVVIGVLQLLNAKNEQGDITPFPTYIEPVICAVASLAAVAIRNMRHLAEIDSMLHSFVRVISTAIDERSPYNANHTRKIARLSGAFARYLKENPATSVTITAEDVEQLIMSAWLHDIGKIAIPLDIMDKSSRLGERYELVQNRFTAIREQRKVEVVKQAFKEKPQLKTAAGVAAVWEELKRIDDEMDQAAKLVATVNNAVCFVGAILQKRVAKLAERTWLSPEGGREPWLTPAEVESLTVPQGTLTDKERQTMKSHVEITKKCSSKFLLADVMLQCRFGHVLTMNFSMAAAIRNAWRRVHCRFLSAY